MKIILILLFSFFSHSSDPFNALIWDKNYKGSWYEWWYFKLYDQKSETPFFFLYGVTNPWDYESKNKVSRSFVSFGNFKEKWWVEKNFPVSQFKASKKVMDVQVSSVNGVIERSAFGHIIGEYNGQKHDIKWDLKITPDWKFNAMGWTMDVSWSSNIFWYPAQASMFVSGIIEADGKTYVLENAPGYQDRNWGKSFPQWWAWIVSNQFKNSPGTVLAGGGGLPDVVTKFKIPIFVLGLRHQGKEYSFRLNDGDLVRMKIAFGHWWVSAISKNGYRVDIEGRASEDKFMDLVFVTPQGEKFHDLETLEGNIVVKLYKLKLNKWALQADLESNNAGLEFGSFQESYQKNVFEISNF